MDCWLVKMGEHEIKIVRKKVKMTQRLKKYFFLKRKKKFLKRYFFRYIEQKKVPRYFVIVFVTSITDA